MRYFGNGYVRFGITEYRLVMLNIQLQTITHKLRVIVYKYNAFWRLEELILAQV